MNKVIICLLGMCGAGKSEVADELKRRNFPGVYFGQVIMDELKKSKMELNAENEKHLREELRENEGMAVFAKRSFPKIKKLLEGHNHIYIDGLYSYEEYTWLKDHLSRADENGIDIAFVLIEVYADKLVRHNRLQSRAIRPLNAAESKARDIFEIEKLNKAAPIALSDYKLENNGSKEQLKVKLQDLLHKLSKTVLKKEES